MKKLISLVFILLVNNLWSQEKDIKYLMFDKSMQVQNVDNRVKLSFDLAGKDKKDCIYNFEIDNSTHDFKYLKFEYINIEILNEELKDKNILNLADLSNIDFCDLKLLFADTKHLFLLRVIKGKTYKYRLIFHSTQRGWSLLKN